MGLFRQVELSVWHVVLTALYALMGRFVMIVLLDMLFRMVDV